MTTTRKIKIEFTEEELIKLGSARDILDEIMDNITLNRGCTIYPLDFTDELYDISELGLCHDLIDAIVESGFIEVE